METYLRYLRQIVYCQPLTESEFLCAPYENTLTGHCQGAVPEWDTSCVSRTGKLVVYLPLSKIYQQCYCSIFSTVSLARVPRWASGRVTRPLKHITWLRPSEGRYQRPDKLKNKETSHLCHLWLLLRSQLAPDVLIRHVNGAEGMTPCLPSTIQLSLHQGCISQLMS